MNFQLQIRRSLQFFARFSWVRYHFVTKFYLVSPYMENSILKNVTCDTFARERSHILKPFFLDEYRNFTRFSHDEKVSSISHSVIRNVRKSEIFGFEIHISLVIGSLRTSFFVQNIFKSDNIRFSQKFTKRFLQIQFSTVLLKEGSLL